MKDTYTVYTEVADKLVQLDETAFMCVIGCLFDEYHHAHKEFDAVKQAQVVADTVKMVNETMGEF